MRFLSDFRFLKAEGFVTWQLRAPVELCAKRLLERGQEFRIGYDDGHRGETELLSMDHDVVLDASLAVADIYQRIDCELSKLVGYLDLELR